MNSIASTNRGTTPRASPHTQGIVQILISTFFRLFLKWRRLIIASTALTYLFIMAILIGTTKDGSSTESNGRTLFPDGRNQKIHHLEKDHQTRSYSPPKTIFVVSLQGTPGAHDSNNGRLDLFKEKWRNACGSSSAFTHIEHCAAPLDSRRGYGVTWAWILCVWRARQLNEEAVIFLEDDARLFENSTDDFCDVKRRGQLLSKLPDDTFLAFLGGHTWFYKDTKVPFRQVRHSYGAYGFVVPRESIDDFYEALSSGLLQGRNKALNPEDIFYSAARRCHKSIYAFNPLIVWHEGGYSNTWGRVRGNITGLESHKQGINTSSGRKRLVTKIATRTIADQEQEMNHLHKPSTFGAGAAKCTFCEGKEMSDGDLIVPDTGGKTCISIKAMAAGEVDGSEICAIMQKEENVCCPGVRFVKVPRVQVNHQLANAFQHTNYVVISSTLDIFARDASYDYLVPLVARNWFLRGFVPIVLIVADDSRKIEMTRNLWGPIMPKDALVVPIIAASEIAITVAQIARLYAAQLVPEAPGDAFLRITDADMMIMDNQPFLPTQQFLNGQSAITIFNGKCCLRNNQYPMHSVGMNISLWRQLFPMQIDTSNATTVIMNLVAEEFNVSMTNPVKHGGKGWSMDQVFLARVINQFGQAGHVDLAPGPRKRLHINHKWGNANSFTDVHLARFSLASHHQWLTTFVTETDALKGYIEPYTSYTERYSLAHNISLPMWRPSTFGAGATKCTFCEGKEMSDGDLIVPDTGGDTCSSIKAMAAGEVDGSEICAIMQKEETVCCPKNATIQEVDTLLPSSWNISAIIPACKRLHSLRDAIESALKQTYPVLEVIVAIGSNPDCVNSINNIWEGKDNRVRVLKVPPCPQPSCGTGPYGNLSRNRNYAIGKASPYATHFAMLDDDDLWYPRKTEIQVKKMQEGNYSYSSSDANMPSNGRCHGAEYKPHDLENEDVFSLANGGKFKKYVSKKLNIPLDAKLPSHVTQKELRATNIFIASATLFSKDIFYATSGFDEGVDRAEDHRLWLQFAKIRPGLFITDPLVVYDNNKNGCDVNYTSDLYVGGRVFKPSPPRLSDVGSKEEEKGGAHVDEAQILQTSSQPQRVHFRTYGNERYNWTKARIVQEALDTGWFASVKALGPDDLTADFKKSFEDILKLPRGGGYWIWKYNVIEQTLESMNEGDFLVYLDAGSRVNKGGEKRFREYLKIVNESQYDMLCFQYPFVEEKYTTGRIFRAFNISMEDPIRTSGQIEGGTLLMQKGPHLRSWLKLIMDALLQDPWIITDKYNREEKALNKGFKDNRHDQSISSVSRKIHGCEKVSFMESNNKQPDQPFHVMRLRKQPKE